MAGFGETLRREREARGFTLPQISAGTKIGVNYLEALERDDLSSLPGGAFNKGYVRNYAQFIGADADSLVAAYLREEQAQVLDGRIESPDLLEELERRIDARSGRRSSRISGASLAAVLVPAVLLVAAAAWWWLGRGRDAGPEPVDAATAPASEIVETAPIPATKIVEAVESPVEVIVETAGVTEAEAEAEAEVDEPAAIVEAPQASPPPPPIVTEETPVAEETPTAAPSPIEIPDFGIGTGIENRVLVGEAERFPAGTQVYFWTRVLGANPGDLIYHVWLHEGIEVGRTELTIGASHWRTQSRKTLNTSGVWTVEARDAGGRVLARATVDAD